MRASNHEKQISTGLLKRNLLEADDVGLVGQKKKHEQSIVWVVVN
jgi:hypothetical protein